MVAERKLSIAVISACIAAVGLAGCVLPEGGYAYPEATGGYPQPAQPQPAPFDGCWSFYDTKGARAMNLVETLDENTLLVTPLRGAGATRQYVRIGESLYQDADGAGTYQFAAGGGVWRSNDKRKITFRLTHEGRSC